MKHNNKWTRRIRQAGLLGLFFVISIAVQAQDDGISEVPVLTGSTGFFTRVTGGQYQHAPSVSPLLLIPMGSKLLIEAKGSFSDTYAEDSKGDYNSTVSYGLGYAQIDYIANRYVTLTAGRFIVPFNIYGERLAPPWIKALQLSPLTSPITSGSSLGGMIRGGIPATKNVNVTYAFYFSANNTHHLLATDRSTGGRISFFMPRRRLEVGASFQQVLQLDRAHSSGIFAEWQPNRLPLTVRSEYAHQSGAKGTGYWIEPVYRLSQIPHLRRLELAGRGQQFFHADNLTAKQLKKLGALGRDTKEGDFGLNYYLNSDVRASATYGRQFAFHKDANLWAVGITYRFVMPMWPHGGAL